MRTEEREAELGRRVRALRIARRLTQSELSESANVSLGAVKNLERGTGSTTTTLIKVLRALAADDWISTLGPGPEPFNPLQVLDARRSGRTKPSGPQRVRHRTPRT
jgi:transcriptional regulator with XRE-family HTH domain